MAIDLAFRRQQVRGLTNKVGCYVLCDLDNVPLYVGQSTDGIRSRVNRHLTSARSDIIANRQIDVWEIAWVWTYPVDDASQITPLEDALFYEFHVKSALMNGKAPKKHLTRSAVPSPKQVVRHRQLVALRLRESTIRTTCSWLCRGSDAGDLGPNLEGLGAGGSILGGGHLMAAKVEEVVDPVVGGKEALRLAG